MLYLFNISPKATNGSARGTTNGSARGTTNGNPLGAKNFNKVQRGKCL
jgi:hypothetical protein